MTKVCINLELLLLRAEILAKSKRSSLQLCVKRIELQISGTSCFFKLLLHSLLLCEHQYLSLRLPSSFFSHFIYFLKASKDSDSIPLSSSFIFLAFLVHLNLALLLHPLIFNVKVCYLSHPVPLAVSAVAPVLCMILGKSWRTIAWWCITPTISILVQTIQGWIAHGNKSIVELESLKYVARGA
jgi:hypothetical protein